MVRRGQPLLADMVHLPGTCMGSLTWDVLSYLRGLLRIRQGQDCFPEMRDIIHPVLHWLQDRLRRKPLNLVGKEAARVTLFDTLAEPPPYSTERQLARDRVDIVLNDVTEGVQQVGGMRVKYRGGMAEVHNSEGQSVATVPQGRLLYLLSQVDSDGAREDLVLSIVSWKAARTWTSSKISASRCSSGM